MKQIFGVCALILSWSTPVTTEENLAIYFGLGCFWHIQYKFIQAEKSILGRSGSELTSITGYAAASGGGQFCYNDGKLHAEAVQIIIPVSSVPSFAAVFWGMFVGKDRSHTNDRGSNYRAVLGLPGGMNSTFLPQIQAAQQGVVAQTFELRSGTGDDADTLGSALVWVYDSDTFPFQQAETYHQFHDDYLPGGDYPSSYNQLTSALQSSGRLVATTCPNDGGRGDPGDLNLSPGSRVHLFLAVSALALSFK